MAFRKGRRELNLFASFASFVFASSAFKSHLTSLSTTPPSDGK